MSISQEAISNAIDLFFQYTSFWKVPIINMPFCVFFGLVVAIYLMFKFNFVQIKLFKHAIDIVKDKYTTKNAPGSFTPKQAIMTAALGTVGLGSVGGMAIAITMGGAGAVFWVIIAGVVISVLKFAEITLGHKFRKVDIEKGTAHGGPFQYIEASMNSLKMHTTGKVIGKIYAFVMIFCAFVTTNMFQCSQTMLVLGENFPILEQYSLFIGLLVAGLVGATILGGVSAVAKVGSAMVPFMTISYVLCCLIILAVNFLKLPAAFAEIMTEAFNLKAISGGMLGGLAYGSLRSFFTTESGAGTSAIAHSSSKTSEPIMEGCTAFIEVLFPMVVCLMTGLIIVATGSHHIGGVGIVLTSNAFKSVADWFPIILTLQVPFLAITTTIAWGMYGTGIWSYFFNDKVPGWIFKVLFLVCTVLGFVIKDASLIVKLGDYLWNTMTIPNIIILFLMRNVLKDDLLDYLKRLNSGAIKKVN